MRKNIIIALCILTLAFVSCSDSGSENSSIKSAVSTLDSVTTDTELTITLAGKADQKNLLLFKEALLRLEAKQIGSGFINIDMASLYGFTTLDTAYFGNMAILKSVRLPNVLEELPKYLFAGCKNLKEATIPSAAAYVGYAAFHDCAALEKLNIESSVLELGQYAFYEINTKMKVNCQATDIYYLESWPFDIQHADTFYTYLPVKNAIKIRKTVISKEGNAKDFNLSVRYFSDSDYIYASVDDENGSCFSKIVTFLKNDETTVVTGTDIDGIFAGAANRVVLSYPTDGSSWYYTNYQDAFYSREGGRKIEFEDSKDREIDTSKNSSYYFYKVAGGQV